MQRTLKQLLADYADYCEAKREIKETPLSYADWLYLEEQAEEDKEAEEYKTWKRCQD